METIQSLLEIMRSQIALYHEMADILTQEKEAAVKWDASLTNELTKKKDTLAYKEKVLSEAFVSCIRKIEKETGREGLRVEIIARELAGGLSGEMMQLRNELLELTKKVNNLNMSLKILFKSNMSLINSLFTKLRMGGRNTYGINKEYSTTRTSTICQTG